MRVAVTGGIAEGKTTVLGYLAEAGYRVASADRLAREVFLEGETQAFLAQALGSEGPVAPERLREGIAQDSRLRRLVNAHMHPRILARLRSADAQFLEVPLLLETCLQGFFDEVWVVTCGPDEQRRRLVERVGEPDADRWLSTQLPTDAKVPFADVVLRTIGDFETVRRDVLVAVAQGSIR